jgi:hypothetical protein
MEVVSLFPPSVDSASVPPLQRPFSKTISSRQAASFLPQVTLAALRVVLATAVA